jgi:hypothetical protein
MMRDTGLKHILEAVYVTRLISETLIPALFKIRHKGMGTRF